MKVGASGGGGAKAGVTGGLDLSAIKLPVKVPAVMGFGPPGSNTGTYVGKGRNEFSSSRNKGLEGNWGLFQDKPDRPALIDPRGGDLYRDPNILGDRARPENPSRFPQGKTIPASLGGGGPTSLMSQIAAVSTAITNLGKIQVQIMLLNTNAITAIQTTSGEIIKLGLIKSQISLLNTNAITSIQTTAGEINNLTKVKAVISLLNTNAINAIQTTAGEISGLTKVKASISLLNRSAFSSIHSTAEEINKLTKVKASITLLNRNAFNAIEVIENKIKDLTKIKPTITVKVQYDTSAKPAGIKADSGGI